jgi:hypothetical protein
VALAVVGALGGDDSRLCALVTLHQLFGAFWNRNRNHPCMMRIFDILRPLVTGLVITAAVLLLLHALWGESFRAVTERLPDLRMAAIAAAAFALTAFSKVSLSIFCWRCLRGIVLGWI